MITSKFFKQFSELFSIAMRTTASFNLMFSVRSCGNLDVLNKSKMIVQLDHNFGLNAHHLRTRS